MCAPWEVVATSEAVAATFEDVEALAARCRFRDCAHGTEPGRAVVQALVEGTLPERRLESWRKLQREALRQALRADARLAAAEREKGRQRQREMRERHRVTGGPRR